MQVYTTTKRAACDRCHRLKLRCTGAESEAFRFKPCRRCRTAETSCKFSAPRKPGRPPAAGKATAAGGNTSSSSTVVPSTNIEAAPSPVPSSDSAPDAWADEILAQNTSLLSEAESLALFGDPAAISNLNWPTPGFTNDDHIYLDGLRVPKQLDMVCSGNSLHGHSNTANHHEALDIASFLEWHPPTPLTPAAQTQLDLGTSHHVPAPYLNGSSGSSSAQIMKPQGKQTETVITPTSHARDSGSGSSTPCNGEGELEKYMQRFSKFNMRLARSIDIGPDIAPDKLAQAAAHVLESSTIFLGLVNSPYAQGCSKPADPLYDSGSHTPVDTRTGQQASHSLIPDTGLVLQLVAFSIRLAEMYHSLFVNVYEYLSKQDHNGWRHANSINSAEAHPASQLSISLSIAGVTLPIQPRFQLQILLQTGAHYLTSVQQALCGLDALQECRGASSEPHGKMEGQGPASQAALMRALMMQGQQGKMSGIREVVAKLRDEFDIVVHLE